MAAHRVLKLIRFYLHLTGCATAFFVGASYHRKHLVNIIIIILTFTQSKRNSPSLQWEGKII